MNVVGVGEQHVDSAAVQVIDAAEVDDDRRVVARRCGVIEVGYESVYVGLVDLPRCGQQLRAIVAPVDAEAQWRRHHAILACICTVVPVSRGWIVTSCINARMSEMPRPRCAAATGGFHEPASTTVT